MAVSYEVFIGLACEQVLSAGDPNLSPLQDMEMVAESLVPQVFQQYVLDCAGNPDKLSLLRRTHTVALTNGVGVLPDVAMTQEIFGSTVDVTDDPTIGPLMSYTPWVSFVSPSNTLLGYYSLRGDTELFWVDPGEVYTPGSGRTSDIDLTISSVPEIPATETDPLIVPDEALSDLIALLAAAVRGQIKKAA